MGKKASGDNIDYEMYVEDYKAVIRALREFPVEASRELRLEAEIIADEIVAPAIRHAIETHAPSYAPKLNATVVSTRDRIPKVRVGNNNRYSPISGRSMNTRAKGAVGAFSGGATTNMIRFGTIKGPYTYRAGGEASWAQNITPGWTDAAEAVYFEPAFRGWETAVKNLVRKWDRGSF